MSSESQHINAIVVKKTKLSESDLIVSFLCDNGKQVRAVAKGARRPSSTFAARLELFSNVRILIAKGKNLDIVREAKIIKSYSTIRKSIEKIACASPAAEITDKATSQNLINDNIFPMFISFLNEVEILDSDIYLKCLCEAFLIKLCSILGFRPSFAFCVNCGDNMEAKLQNVDIPLSFSFEEGGLLCMRCSKNYSSERISAKTIKFLHNLIHIKFEEIKFMRISSLNVDEALKFCKKWILYYIGAQMKSLDFYIKNMKSYK